MSGRSFAWQSDKAGRRRDKLFSLHDTHQACLIDDLRTESVIPKLI
jgi:hypothetical protein